MKEKAIDSSLISSVSSNVKGKTPLRKLFKEYFDLLNVGYYDPCCADNAKCPPLSTQAGNILQCLSDGLFASGGGGSVTSVGLIMPSAFTVTNSPITGSGVLTASLAGTSNQYLAGDGTLIGLPVTGAANGLSISGTNTVLGGALTGNTTITSGTYILTLSGSPSFAYLLNVTASGGFSGGAINATCATVGAYAIIANGGTTVGSGLRILMPSSNSNLAIYSTGNGSGDTSNAHNFENRGSGGAVLALSSYQPLGLHTNLRLNNTTTFATGGTNGAGIDFVIGSGTTPRAARIVSTRTDNNSPAALSGDIRFYTTNATIESLKVTISKEGYLGIGVTPTAYLSVIGGTATAPSILINSGTLLTTPVNGALENDGTNLYFTLGGTRKIVQLGTTTGTIYTTDGTLSGNRAVDMSSFSLTFNNSALFRVKEGNTTIGGTYDFNGGVDFLVYDASNSSNLIINSSNGCTFEYVDVATTNVLSSFVVDIKGIKLTGLPTYADNASAITGGLTAGYLYRNGDVVQIVH